MLLAKFLILTALSFSQASRPAIGDYPFDYEFASDLTCKIVKYVNIDLYAKILFEREEGQKGTGHDVNFSYKDYDYFFKNLEYKRSFTSYYRQVKKISLQTIDTSYELFKYVRLGYSLGFESFANTKILLYVMLDLKYFQYEIRLNHKTLISKLKMNYEINKIKGFTPFLTLEYINTGDYIDWTQKIGIRWKFNTCTFKKNIKKYVNLLTDKKITNEEFESLVKGQINISEMENY